MKNLTLLSPLCKNKPTKNTESTQRNKYFLQREVHKAHKNNFYSEGKKKRDQLNAYKFFLALVTEGMGYEQLF